MSQMTCGELIHELQNRPADTPVEIAIQAGVDGDITKVWFDREKNRVVLEHHDSSR